MHNHRLRLPVAALLTVSAVATMSACEVPPTAAQPASPTAPTAPTTAGQTEASTAPPTLGSGVPADPADPAGLASAAAATRAITAAFIRYATVGFDRLTATSWAAQVSASPATATGSGELLVDGTRSPTDFTVAGGRLTIQNADGSRADVGAARGVLDPTALLDPLTGLGSVVAALTDAVPDAGPAELDGAPMVRLAAKLPADSARLLLPADAVAGLDFLPATVWLDPAAGYALRQLILTAADRSVRVTVLPTAG